MSLETLTAILPILLVAFGLVLTMILIIWQRSKILINLLTQAILLMTLLACTQLLFNETQQVTNLLKVDSVGIYAYILIVLSSMVAVSMSRHALNKSAEFHDEYYLLLQLVVLGAGILCFSDHFASLFLGFELLSISFVGLVGYFNERQSNVETGFKYLILSATASSFMLLGMAFMYSQTGELTFSLNTQSAHNLYFVYLVGVTLLFVGIFFKLSLMPFHLWAPDIYQGSPVAITLLLATVSKVSIFVVLLKLYFAQQQVLGQSVQTVFVVVGCLSMILGNALALRQNNIKRLLAYSSIAHMGYLLIVAFASNKESFVFAWQSALFYLTAYTVASVSLFYAIDIMQHSNDSGLNDNQQTLSLDEQFNVSNLTGGFWQKPLLACIVSVSVLSLAGIPLTAGFIGKFYLLSHASHTQQWLLISALVLGSGIALVYYLNIIFTLFKKVDTSSEQYLGLHINDVKQAFIFILIALTLVIGIFPDVLNNMIVTLH